MDRGDLRIPNGEFAKMKAGRHGNWGTDGRFYWSQVKATDSTLYVCYTDTFGVTWGGWMHSLAPGTPPGYAVSLLAFDERGTMYVLHANKLYVSFDQGSSFRYVHTLPVWGDGEGVTDNAASWFVAEGGTIQLGLKVANGSGGCLDPEGCIAYRRGTGADTASISWSPTEIILGHDSPEMDFLQIAVDGNGIPTVGYALEGENEGDSITSSRGAPP
jgi:hypothetical protein